MKTFNISLAQNEACPATGHPKNHFHIFLKEWKKRAISKQSYPLNIFFQKNLAVANWPKIMSGLWKGEKMSMLLQKLCFFWSFVHCLNVTFFFWPLITQLMRGCHWTWREFKIVNVFLSFISCYSRNICNLLGFLP